MAWQWNRAEGSSASSHPSYYTLFPKVCSHLPSTSVSFFLHSVTAWLAYRCMCTSILLLQELCVSDPALSSFPSSCVAIPAPVPPDLLTKKWHSECVVCHQSCQFLTSKLPEHIQIGSFLPHIHLFDANSLLMSTRLLKWILSRKCLFVSLLCMSCSCSSALIFHPIYNNLHCTLS